jgi:dynein regulatory complex protein 1
LAGNETTRTSSQEFHRMDIREPVNHFHNVLKETTKLVTSIRIEGDIEENERRIKQEVKTENIEQKLQIENKTSAKVNAAIQMKWASIQEISLPQELNNELKEQMAACKKIIESKDRLIQELNNELRYKDEEYVNALQKQSKDIDLLISRMREQIAVLMQEYETQLVNIETAFDKERSLILKKNEEVLEEMKQKRRDLEKKGIDDRKAKADEFQEELETLRNQE